MFKGEKREISRFECFLNQGSVEGIRRLTFHIVCGDVEETQLHSEESEGRASELERLIFSPYRKRTSNQASC